MEIQLNRIGITKEQLQALGMNEAKFFILLTQLANELSMLRKLIIASAEIPDDAEAQLQDQADALQVMCLLRIVAGKLYEGNQLIEEYFVRRHIKDGYRNEVDLNNVLADIISYMAHRPNSIEHIRNNYSFHHTDDDDSIPNMLRQLPNGHVFENYFGQGVATTFFYGSEMLTVSTLLNEVLPELENSVNSKLPALQQELLRLMGYFDKFATQYIFSLVMRLRNSAEWNNLGNLEAEQFPLSVPNIADIHVPFFIGGNPRNPGDMY
jgi:hypothetical protein